MMDLLSGKVQTGCFCLKHKINGEYKSSRLPYSRLWPQVLPKHRTDTQTGVWKHGRRPTGQNTGKVVIVAITVTTDVIINNNNINTHTPASLLP